MPGTDGRVTMARTLNNLTEKQVEAVSEPGRYADGGGLFLDVRGKRGDATGTKTWVFIYRSPVHRTERKGKPIGQSREMGLGPHGTTAGRVSLAKARELASASRALLADGKDPIDERDREAAPVATVPTFGEMADQYVATMRSSWKNEKHAEQWAMTLRDYAAPLRSKPVDQIDVIDVLDCLKAHWSERPETADRLRGRIERVLNAAKAKGHRTGENPAAWRGHLENLLPKRQKLTRGHHPAMPWQDVPEFIGALHKREGIAALCLEFLILTATRSNESRGARWAEIDLAANVWIIPPVRMKTATEHRVPLTDRALAILEIVKPMGDGEGLIFPSTRPGNPLSDMSLSAVLKRMKRENVTVHGFRSSFRDWAGETTTFSREIAEVALAHVVGNKVERAYRRGDALAKRRELMTAWERFCLNDGAAKVIPFKLKTAQGST